MHPPPFQSEQEMPSPTPLILQERHTLQCLRYPPSQLSLRGFHHVAIDLNHVRQVSQHLDARCFLCQVIIDGVPDKQNVLQIGQTSLKLQIAWIRLCT